MAKRRDTSEQAGTAAIDRASSVSTADSRAPGKSTVTGMLKKAFTFPAFLGALLLAGAFVGTFSSGRQGFFSSFQPLRWVESDTLWHIKVGNLIIKTHAWPTHDIYSFSAHGVHWIAYEWLGEVVMALAWRAGGMLGLAVLLMALLSAIILALFYYAYIGSKNVKPAFVACAVLLPLAAISWTLRPQLLGYLFLIVTLIALKRFRQGFRKSLWILPVVFLLWTNSHGTFILGFGAMGIYWLSGLKEFHFGDIYGQRWAPQERRQLELTALLCLVASIITPYGTQLAAYPLEMLHSQPMILKAIQEWQPLTLTDSYGKLFLVLILAFWVLTAARRVHLRLEDAALLLIATGETFLHLRFMVLFVSVFAPVLAESIKQWFSSYDQAKDHPILNFALIALILAGMVQFFPSNARLEQQLAIRMPVKAVAFLDSHPGLGPTFNYFFWGGYLILNRGPSHKVFIDGRLDIYEYSGVLADYMSIISVSRNAAFLLRKYHIRSCLIPPGSSLATLLGTSPAWKRVYRDNLSEIFVREHANKNGGDGSPSSVAKAGPSLAGS